MKTFFPRRKTFTSSYFLFFQRSESSYFLPEKPQGWKDIFKYFYHMIYDTHSTANLLPLAILKKFNNFFSKKPYIYFLKNSKFWTTWETSLFQSSSTAKLQEFDEKNLTFRYVNNRCWLVYASPIDKHRMKKRNHLKDFAFHIFNMAQNNKTHRYHRHIWRVPVSVKMPF